MLRKASQARKFLIIKKRKIKKPEEDEQKKPGSYWGTNEAMSIDGPAKILDKRNVQPE